jgi:hypothetical protein
MALRATLECYLPRQDLGTYQEDGRSGEAFPHFRSGSKVQVFPHSLNDRLIIRRALVF